MKRKLLLRIADMLDALTPAERRHFDMTTWHNRCGTAGCAIGFAAIKGLIPGVAVRRDDIYEDAHMTLDGPPMYDISGTLAQKLGIDQVAFDWLFMPDSYRTEPFFLDDIPVSPSEVSSRIRSFVRNFRRLA